MIWCVGHGTTDARRELDVRHLDDEASEKAELAPGSGMTTEQPVRSPGRASASQPPPLLPRTDSRAPRQALRRRQLLKSLALDESNDYSYQRNNHCCNNVLQKHNLPPFSYFLDIAFIPRYIRYPTTIAPTVVQNSRMSFSFLHRLPWRMRGYYRISSSAICDFGCLRISKEFCRLRQKARRGKGNTRS